MKNRGFLALTTILILCTTILAISASTFLRSMDHGSQLGDLENSTKALGVVDSCGEYALSLMVASTSATTTATNWSYAGDESLSVGTETCYIYGVEDQGENKIIKASSTVRDFTRKLLIEIITSTPKMQVGSWKYVADF